MSVGKWLGGVRMFMGFLIAPAWVPIWSMILLAVFIDSREIDCGAGIAVIIGGIPTAIVVWYACIIGVGLPWILLMQSRGELCLWAILAPILAVAYPSAALFFIIGAMSGLLIGVVAALWLPVVLLSVLCFYFVAVWRPSGLVQEGS